MALFVHTLFFVQIGVGFVACFIMLYLQYGAFRRHKQRNFLLLIIGTAFGIATIAVSLALRLLATTLVEVAWWYSAAFALYCIQAVVVVFGSAELFSNYRRLADDKSRTNGQSGITSSKE